MTPAASSPARSVLEKFAAVQMIDVHMPTTDGRELVHPGFARLRFTNGSFSAPAVVTLIDALRETVREARGKHAESSALRLSEETAVQPPQPSQNAPD